MWQEWLGILGLYTGIIVSAVGIIGIYRFPDVYTRLNVISKVTTVGAVLVHLSIALLLPEGQGARSVLIALVLLLTTPVSTHQIALAAHRLRVPNIAHRDDLEEAERP